MREPAQRAQEPPLPRQGQERELAPPLVPGPGQRALRVLVRPPALWVLAVVVGGAVVKGAATAGPKAGNAVGGAADSQAGAATEQASPPLVPPSQGTPAAASRTVDAAPGRSVLGAAVRAVHRLGGVLARASAPVGPATSAVVQADREGVTCDVYEHAREQ